MPALRLGGGEIPLQPAPRAATLSPWPASSTSTSRALVPGADPADGRARAGAGHRSGELADLRSTGRLRTDSLRRFARASSDEVQGSGWDLPLQRVRVVLCARLCPAVPIPIGEIGNRVSVLDRLSGMSQPNPSPSPSPPGWPHCGEDASAENSTGCPGIHVAGHTTCIAHLGGPERDAYLAGLAPGAHIDHRGTQFTKSLLDALLTPSAPPQPATHTWVVPCSSQRPSRTTPGSSQRPSRATPSSSQRPSRGLSVWDRWYARGGSCCQGRCSVSR